MIRSSHACVIKLLKILMFVVLAAVFLYALGRLTRQRSPGPHRPHNPASDSMDVSQACAVLGIEQGEMNKGDVVSAHRRLMQHLHPDKGGSALLAQQLNEAKRVLLQHL
jgi:hypothetical protein